MTTAIPDATQASTLFAMSPETEVFDFAQNWGLCLPHLNHPRLIRVLDRSMREYCRLDPQQGPWSRKNGPWSYTPTSAWCARISDKLEDAEPDWHENHKHLFGDDEDEEPSAAWRTALEEAERKYWPQPDTYEWYQAIRLGWVMCKWSAALGSLVYPELTWCTYEGANWATAVGIRDGRIRTIFDINLFDLYSGDEILASVKEEREDWFEPELRPIAPLTRVGHA